MVRKMRINAKKMVLSVFVEKLKAGHIEKSEFSGLTGSLLLVRRMPLFVNTFLLNESANSLFKLRVILKLQVNVHQKKQIFITIFVLLISKSFCVLCTYLHLWLLS